MICIVDIRYIRTLLKKDMEYMLICSIRISILEFKLRDILKKHNE